MAGTPAWRAASVSSSGRARGADRLGDPDELLAAVLAREETPERIRRVLQAVDDVDLVPELLLRDPAAEVSDGLAELRREVAHQEALHPGAVDDQIGVVPGAARALAVVVAGDRATEGHPRADREMGECGIEDLAPHVVEVDVHPAREELGDAPGHGLRAIVDRRVEPELLGEPAAL